MAQWRAWHYSVTDFLWQEIAKPHASNYGQRYPYVYPGLPTDATGAAATAGHALAELVDGSEFDTLPESEMLQMDAAMVMNRLRDFDGVMTFTGHSGPGVIQFCNDPDDPELEDMTEIATTPAVPQSPFPVVYLNQLESGSLDNVLLVVLLGCNTAGAAPDGTALHQMLVSKGVDAVIAFPGFLHETLSRSSRGKNSQDQRVRD